MALIYRVDLRTDGIRLSVKLPLEPNNGRIASASTQISLARTIPMKLQRRGVEMKLVIGNDTELNARSEPILLKLIARAHCWFDELASGRAASMMEIGRLEKIGKRHVSEMIRLAFLAPDVVEQIVDGIQPPELTTKRILQKSVRLPLDWYTQRSHLAIGHHRPAE